MKQSIQQLLELSELKAPTPPDLTGAVETLRKIIDVNGEFGALHEDLDSADKNWRSTWGPILQATENYKIRGMHANAYELILLIIRDIEAVERGVAIP